MDQMILDDTPLYLLWLDYSTHCTFEYVLQCSDVMIMLHCRNLSPMLSPDLLRMIFLSGVSPTSAHILVVNVGIELRHNNDAFFLINIAE